MLWSGVAHTAFVNDLREKTEKNKESTDSYPCVTFFSSLVY